MGDAYELGPGKTQIPQKSGSADVGVSVRKPVPVL
jgi:hypothetical protein